MQKLMRILRSPKATVWKILWLKLGICHMQRFKGQLMRHLTMQQLFFKMMLYQILALPFQRQLLWIQQEIQSQILRLFGITKVKYGLWCEQREMGILPLQEMELYAPQKMTVTQLTSQTAVSVLLKMVHMLGIYMQFMFLMEV